MPRHLQSEIHSDFSSNSGVWANYKTLVMSLYNASTDPLKTDFDNHLIREYNRKIDILGQNVSLFITPFDAGYRFVGGGETPDANYVFVFTADNEQVFTNIDEAVQVPDNYANS